MHDSQFRAVHGLVAGGLHTLAQLVVFARQQRAPQLAEVPRERAHLINRGPADGHVRPEDGARAEFERGRSVVEQTKRRGKPAEASELLKRFVR